MGLALPGIYSGMDTDAIVTSLMEVNERPLTLLKNRLSAEQSKQTAIADVQSAVTTFQSLLKSLNNSSSLRSATASSSATSVLTVKSTKGAAEGSHTVTVNQVATAQRRIQTTGFASATSSVGQSKSSAVNANTVADADATWFTTGSDGATYTIDFGTETDLTEITFAANTSYTLNEVRDLINARSQSISGYDAASVVEQDGQYVLQLTSKENGAVGAMTATLTSGTAIGELGDESDWTTTDGLTGVFAYTYNGVTRQIATGANATLTSLKDLINNDASNPGVTASILQYNGGYHLVLSAKDTGADNVITIDDTATTLAGFDSADIPETQAAQNAQIRVDGFPTTDWIERSSNSISDVIDGVTLNVASKGDSVVTVTRDTSTLEQNITSLVSVYNSLAAKVADYTGYDSSSETGGVLQGDSTVNLVLQEIRNLLVRRPAGFVSGTDTYTLPSDIGLDFDKEGTLSLDSDKLSEALADNYEGVLALIGASDTGRSSNNYVQFSAASGTTAGTYEVEVDYNASGSIATARIRTSGETAWRFMDISGNELVGASGTPEQGLQLLMVSDGVSGAHTVSATINIQQGFASALYDCCDKLLDDTNGTITVRQNGIQDKIDLLNTSIEREQEHLDTIETNLKAQYARLEATLAKIDTANSGYKALIQQFDSSSSDDDS